MAFLAWWTWRVVVALAFTGFLITLVPAAKSAEGAADLRIVSLELDPSSVFPGADVTSTTYIVNVGSSAADSVKLRLYFSSDSTTADAVGLRSEWLGTIPSGGRVTYVTTFSLPDWPPPGGYKIVGRVSSSTALANTWDDGKVASISLLPSSSTVSTTSTSAISSSSSTYVQTGAADCDYYASPNGGGDGLASWKPSTVAGFWRVAAPGKTLCLLDGTYRGADSMITPGYSIAGRSGDARQPITVRALRDGGVLIDGEGVRRPVFLAQNDWWVLEGFNAANSPDEVIRLYQSSNDVVRRVVAWNSGDRNVYTVSTGGGSTNTLFEDVAAFGSGGRSSFGASQGGNQTTCRRCWGRWEANHSVGGKHVYQLAYNAYDFTCENCVAQFSGERMKETYVLMGDDGITRWTGPTGGVYTNHEIEQPGRAFHASTMYSDKCAGVKLLGSLAYVLASDRFQGGEAVGMQGLDCVKLQDVVAVFQSPSPSKRAFLLAAGYTGTDLVANRLTGIGGGDFYIHSSWRQSGIHHGQSLAEVPNPWTTTTGANLCYRYVNGVRTSVPLWPWPMNQRIAQAMQQAGRRAVDVTQTVASLLGTIPQTCRR